MRRVLALLLGLVLVERVAFATFDGDPRGRPSDRAPETHRENHQAGGVDDLSHPLLGSMHSDTYAGQPGDPALGALITAQTQSNRVLWSQLATGAAGTVFIGGSSFSANLLLSGYARLGASTAGLNTTAGDLTVVRLSVGNVTIATNVEAQVNGDTVITGWTRIGSTTAPTNTTAGDLTVERILAGNGTLASGVVAAFAGNQTTTGWTNIGAATAPSNTTAGDLTAKRAHIGTDGAFTSGKELEVVGDALISQTFQVGGNVGFYGSAVAAQGTGGQNVTNSVTDSGSTAGTIPDITDGIVYANDYTNLRRALFQLARMLKQDHDQLRAMGILT